MVGIDREAHQRSSRRQAKSYQALSREISQLLHASMRERRRQSLLFSARHVLEFLHLTATSAAQADWTPLDLVKASRLSNKVKENMESHILNLVSLFPHYDDVVDVATPLIASSFLLNHYVPDIHSMCRSKLIEKILSKLISGLEFDPAAVFDSLYQECCDNIARAIAAHRNKAGLPIMTHDFPSLIVKHLCALYDHLEHHGGPKSLHRLQLAHA